MSQILQAGTVAPDFRLNVTADQTAPDFRLNVTADQTLSLSDLEGKPIILAFYPADWSPICGDQMTLYNETLPQFHKHDAQLLGISVDGAWCHAAFAQKPPPALPPARRFRAQGCCG